MVQGPMGLPLDLYKTSDADQVSNLVKFLFKAIIKDSGVYVRAPNSPRGLQDAIRVICLNLLSARYSHPRAYVFYSRSSGYYTAKPVSYRYLTRAMDALDRLQLIEQMRGMWRTEDGTPLRTRVRALDSMVELFARFSVQLRMINVHPNFQRIRIKDANKDPMPLPTGRFEPALKQYH